MQKRMHAHNIPYESIVVMPNDVVRCLFCAPRPVHASCALCFWMCFAVHEVLCGRAECDIVLKVK